MKRNRSLIGILLGMCLAFSTSEAAPAASRKDPEYKQGELLVKLRPGSVREGLDPDVMSLRSFRTPAAAKGLAIERWAVARLRKNTNMAKVRGRLLRNPNVESAEYNFKVSADVIPNDPSFPQLWGLDNTGQTGGSIDADIDAPEAWDLAQGELAPVLVGVIDTGVDYQHPDLVQNIWTNAGEIAGNSIDDDANGYVDDVHGYDFINLDGDPMDDHGHGTHVSGTIAAVADNGVGVTGVSRNARIMALKFLGADGSGYTDGAINAVLYATSMGAKLTNNSWGGGGFSQALYDAITTAHASGSLFVAAAGNNYGSNNDVSPHYPSNYTVDNVIAVAATNASDTLASFSNIGPTTVDLAAPGESILSTLPGATYGTYSGTSMATPHVTGALAVVRGLYPNDSHMSAKARVLNGVDRLSALTGKVATNGRLNFNNALENDVTAPAAVSDLVLVEATPFEAQLAWTGVGDDGLAGQSSGYVIYYSTAAIDEGNLGTTPHVAVVPLGSQNGEQHVVGGLTPDTTYHVRVVAIDNVGNRSTLSNDAVVLTKPITTAFQDDFETGLGKWTIEGTDGVGGPALWHDSNFRYASPTKAAYYGLEGVFTFKTGAANRGSMTTSVPVDLRYMVSPTLSFKYSLQTEGGTAYDRARVLISADGAAWDELAVLDNTNGAMSTANVDLSMHDGEVVYLRFDFDTVDEINNNYEGWVIDDISVWGTPREAPVAVISGPGLVRLNVPAAFDANGSFDPQGDPLSFEWVVNGVLRGTGPALTETFTSYGDLVVFVTVSDGQNTDTASKVVTVENPPPVVSLVGPTLVARGATATFDGSGSYDPEGQAITFAWYVDGLPTNVTEPLFTSSLTPGRHYISVAVSDGTNVANKQLAVDVPNEAPEVSLTGPSVANRIDTVMYTATASDADGDPLYYEWAIDGWWMGSGPSLSVVFSSPGPHTVEVRVTDYYDAAFASMTVEVANSAPVVMLTGPSTVHGSTPVTFDASTSTDADGDSLSFDWTVDGIPAGTASTLTTSFAEMGLHTVSVTVFDGYVSSSASQTIEATNNAPVVTLTGPSTTHGRTLDTFDASATVDQDGDTLTFAWSVDGIAIGSNASVLTTALEVPGTHSVAVAVSDGYASVSKSLTVEVTNGTPTVSVSGPSVTNRIDTATYTADGADPDNDSLNYTWRIDGVPMGYGQMLSVRFTTVGQHVVDVTASDGYASASASQNVEVVNVGPSASLTGPATVDRVHQVIFDATGSADADGDSLSYAWSLDGVALPPPPMGAFGSTLPIVFEGVSLGTHTIGVTVSDGVQSAVQSLTFEVVNLAPTASAGAPQTVVQKTMVTLGGSGSDPDGTNLTYAWTQIGGPAVTLLNGATPTAGFEAPALRGTTTALLSFELTVTDADGASHSAQTSVTVVKN